MTKHLGKARYPLILLLAVAIVALFVRIQSIQDTRAALFYPEPTPAQLATALVRAGLDPEALAAAGVSPSAIDTVVGDVVDHMTANPGSLELADSAYAAARQERDQLKRVIQSGRATQEQIDAYPGAVGGFALAQSQRQSALDDVFTAGTATLSQGQRNTLISLRGNAAWDLPLEFLVLDLSEADWVQLRDYLANERVSAQLGEDPDGSAQAALTQLRSNPLVATADANLDTSLAVVELAWHQAVDQ
jgi:hypothetical protein